MNDGHLSTATVKMLKKQTGYKKKKRGDVLILEIEYGSVAYTTWKNACPSIVKLLPMPFYGDMLLHGRDGQGIVPEAEYMVVHNAVKKALMRGKGEVPAGGMSLGRVVAFKAMEQIRRGRSLPAIAALAPHTVVTRMLVMSPHPLVSILLIKA